MSNITAMRTPRDILNGFAGVQSAPAHLNTPWIDGDYVYASNGHWMVRMPTTPEHADLPKVQKKHPQNAAAMFDGAPWDRLQPMPVIAEPATCRACAGSGRSIERECESCDGMGAFTHYGNDYDCQLCDGEGVIAKAAAANDNSASRCSECHGTGYAFDNYRGTTIIEIGNTWANAGYLKAISMLPNVMFATHEEATRTCAFRFDGGEGLLMPCRDPSRSSRLEVA